MRHLLALANNHGDGPLRKTSLAFTSARALITKPTNLPSLCLRTDDAPAQNKTLEKGADQPYILTAAYLETRGELSTVLVRRPRPRILPYQELSDRTLVPLARSHPRGAVLLVLCRLLLQGRRPAEQLLAQQFCGTHNARQ